MKSFYNRIQTPQAILYFGLILLFIFFCITRLPFYIHYFFPRVTSDSVFYFYVAYLFKIGNLAEVKNLPYDLPIGIPLFYYALFDVSRLTIIYIQSILFFITTSFLFFSVYKYFKKKALIILGIIILYYFDNSVLLFEFGYYTESLFVSFIILFISFTIHFVFSKRYMYLYLIFGTMIFLALIRSNGYVFFIAPLLFFALQSFQNRVFVKRLLISYFTFAVILSSLNLYIKGYFFPVEYKRIESTILNKNVLTQDDGLYIDNPLTKSELFAAHMLSYYKEKPSFYHSALPSMIETIENVKTINRVEIWDKIDKNTRNMMFRDLLQRQSTSILAPSIENKDRYYIIHLFSKAYFYLLKNCIVYFVILISFVFTFVIFFKKKYLTPEIFLLFIPFFLYFLNVIFTVASNVNTNSRYITTYDILLLISLFIIILTMVYFSKKQLLFLKLFRKLKE
jgi:hypothetical protein